MYKISYELKSKPLRNGGGGGVCARAHRLVIPIPCHRTCSPTLGAVGESAESWGGGGVAALLRHRCRTDGRIANRLNSHHNLAMALMRVFGAMQMRRAARNQKPSPCVCTDALLIARRRRRWLSASHLNSHAKLLM